MPVSPFAPPQRRKPEGPVTAVNPQLTGLAQGVSQMASQNAAAAQRNAQGGPSYAQRQMANSPAPSPGLGLAGAAAPAAPQVSHGVPQSTFFQGATPGQVSYSGGQRPGFLGAPAPAGGVGHADQNQWAVANGKYIAPTGAMANSNIFGNMSNQQVKTAGITGRGPNQATLTPEQANAGYAAAKTAAAGRQKASREQTLNRVAIRGQNKQAGFENALAANLAQRDPQAFAQAMTARGQLGLANSNMQATNAYRKDQLAAQERMGTANNASREKIAGLGLQGKGIDPATGQPIVANPVPPVPGLAANTPQATHEQIRSAAAAGDTEAIREALIKQGVTDRGQQNDMIASVTGQAPQSPPLFPFMREPSAKAPTPKQPAPKPRGQRSAASYAFPFLQ